MRGDGGRWEPQPSEQGRKHYKRNSTFHTKNIKLSVFIKDEANEI